MSADHAEIRTHNAACQRYFRRPILDPMHVAIWDCGTIAHHVQMAWPEDATPTTDATRDNTVDDRKWNELAASREDHEVGKLPLECVPARSPRLSDTVTRMPQRSVVRHCQLWAGVQGSRTASDRSMSISWYSTEMREFVNRTN
jgi:hypothetical protein